MKNFFLTSLFCLWAPFSTAAEIDFENAAIKFVPHVSKNSAGYITIKNNTNKNLKLVKAESSLSQSVELHTMTIENNMMKMRPVSSIEIPKEKSVSLKPGGLHIMFMGLKNPLKINQVEKIKLHFDDNTTQEIDFVVKDFNVEAKEADKKKEDDHHHHH